MNDQQFVLALATALISTILGIVKSISIFQEMRHRQIQIQLDRLELDERRKHQAENNQISKFE
jgi:hypothetical protein